MKPYQQIAIQECGEPLVAIPTAAFAVESPHPYVKLAAPYGNRSPYYLRQTVLECLLTAQAMLQRQYPNWRIQIFDAYRPIDVQQFMVEYALQQALQEAELQAATLTTAQRDAVLEKVYQFWAVPSLDPATPPPHSTGAAVDVTLVDADGQIVDMGSEIDEMSPRSVPDYYAPSHYAPGHYAVSDRLTPDEQAQFHQNRQLLQQVMTAAGFVQHPNEWWHFSYGDQLWAWLAGKEQQTQLTARYGAI